MCIRDRFKPGGKVGLVREDRRGFTPIHKNLQTFQFNILEPREAKCCQPWFDKVEDPNDPNQTIGIENITTIRNVHAVLNALKILRCLKCGRQTPGLDIVYSELNVWQQGQKRALYDQNIVTALENPKILIKRHVIMSYIK